MHIYKIKINILKKELLFFDINKATENMIPNVRSLEVQFFLSAKRHTLENAVISPHVTKSTAQNCTFTGSIQ